MTTPGDLSLVTAGEMAGVMDYEDCVLSAAERSDVIRLDGDPKDWPVADRPWIYVAGYYAACPSQGTANAAQWAAKLTDAGWNAYVPHFSLMYDMFMPMPADYWYAYDLGILARMDAMFVCPDLLTKGSSGVTKETLFAVENNIPVFYYVVEAKDRFEE